MSTTTSIAALPVPPLTTSPAPAPAKAPVQQPTPAPVSGSGFVAGIEGKLHGFEASHVLAGTAVGGLIGAATGALSLLAKIKIPLLGKVVDLGGIARFGAIGGAIGLAVTAYPAVKPFLDQHPAVKAAATGAAIGAAAGTVLPILTPVFGAIAGAVVGEGVHLLAQHRSAATQYVYGPNGQRVLEQPQQPGFFARLLGNVQPAYGTGAASPWYPPGGVATSPQLAIMHQQANPYGFNPYMPVLPTNPLTRYAAPIETAYAGGAVPAATLPVSSGGGKTPAAAKPKKAAVKKAKPKKPAAKKAKAKKPAAKKKAAPLPSMSIMSSASIASIGPVLAN